MHGEQPQAPRGALHGWAALAAAVVIGCALGGVLVALYQARLGVLAGNALDIEHRRPYTIALQARLLEPALLRLGADATGLTWTQTFAAEVGVLSVAIVVATTVAFRRYVGTWIAGLCYGALQAAVLVLLHDPEWLHLWDLVDVLIATAFGLAVLSRARLPVFAALFVVGLANRESALFVPLWVALSALPSRKDARPFQPVRFTLGLGGIAFGLAAIWTVRTWLFEGEPVPRRPMLPWGNHFTLWHNADDFIHTFHAVSVRPLVVYAAVVVTGILVHRTTRRLPPEAARLPLLLGLMAVITLLSSVVLETRCWFFFTPLLGFVNAASQVHGKPGRRKFS